MKKLIAGVLVVVTLIASAMVWAHGPGKMFRHLDLSDEQKQQMKVLFLEKREKRQENKAQRLAMKEKIQALMDDYNDADAQVIADEVSQMAREKTLARFAHMQSVLAILDDEQKQKFKSMMAKRMEKKMQRMEERGHGEKGDWL